MIKNLESDFSFLKEWEKCDQIPRAFDKAIRLSQLSLIQKTATNYKLKNLPEKFPSGQIRLEYDQFFKKVIMNTQNSIIFEYVKIAQNRNQTLPLNFIVPLINYAHQNHEMASSILDIFTVTEFYVLNTNPKWNYLNNKIPFKASLHNHEEAFSFFLHFRQEPDKMFEILNNHIGVWNEKFILKILDQISPISSLVDANNWVKLTDKSKGKIKFKLISLLLQNKEEPYYGETIQAIKTFIEQKTFDIYTKSHNIKNFTKLEFINALEHIPSSLYLESKNTKSLIIQLIKEKKLQKLFNSIAQFKDSNAAFKVLKHLIDEYQLTEDINIPQIGGCLDHKAFNELAIYFCSSMKGNIDLEAFLYLIDHYRHFWTDELLQHILDFKNYKVLTNKFELDVFYQLIPYRINPYSKLENSIPQFIKDSITYPLSYSQVIEFRKNLRK
ncbi:MAG: hypothetical protein IT267_08525 [Saprospiraceae bacterium]|nr:hypothetical protein [Saprospiraceae bacterium]